MATSYDSWLAAQACTWPEPYQTWLGGEFQPRRSPFSAASGWECPGCHRCFSPSMRECPHCQPEPQAVTSKVPVTATDGSPAIISVSRPLPAGEPMGEWDDEQ